MHLRAELCMSPKNSFYGNWAHRIKLMSESSWVVECRNVSAPKDSQKLKRTSLTNEFPERTETLNTAYKVSFETISRAQAFIDKVSHCKASYRWLMIHFKFVSRMFALCARYKVHEFIRCSLVRFRFGSAAIYVHYFTARSLFRVFLFVASLEKLHLSVSWGCLPLLLL